MKNRVWAIVAALVVGLALQVGLSAAATGTTSGANAVSKSNVRIHLQGLLSGPQFAAFGGGALHRLWRYH